MATNYKRFADRLAALERLEAEREAAEQPTEDELTIAALDDTALHARVIDGMRYGGCKKRTLLSSRSLGFVGVDSYWDAVAAAANDRILDQGRIPFPATWNELALTLAALLDGRIFMVAWPGKPGTAGFYYFQVPDPLAGPERPLFWWNRPEMEAADAVSHAIHSAHELGAFGDPLPDTHDGLVAFLKNLQETLWASS